MALPDGLLNWSGSAQRGPKPSAVTRVWWGFLAEGRGEGRAVSQQRTRAGRGLGVGSSLWKQADPRVQSAFRFLCLWLPAL